MRFFEGLYQHSEDGTGTAGGGRRVNFMLTIAVIISVVLLAWVAWLKYQTHKQVANDMKLSTEIMNLKANFVHLSEAKTLIIRMSIATGDLKLRNRYNKFEIELNEAIDEATSAIQSEKGKKIIAEIAQANANLVEMDHQAFRLIRSKTVGEAEQVLESTRYISNQNIFSNRIMRLQAVLDRTQAHIVSSVKRYSVFQTAATIVVILVLAIIWFVTLRLIKNREHEILSMSERLKDELKIRREMEQELKEFNERYRAILSTVPEIIVEIDRNEVYQWANGAGLNFYGDDIVGKKASYYSIDEEKINEVEQPLFQGLFQREEGVLYAESWQTRKDGKKRLLALWSHVLKDHMGKVIGAISAARDVTEDRKHEDAERMGTHLLAAIDEVLQKTVHSKTREGVAEVCLRSAEKLVGSKLGLIGMVNHEGRLDVVTLGDSGWSACKVPKEEAEKLIKNMEVRGYFGRAIKRGESEIVNDPGSDPDSVKTPSGHPRIHSFLGVPLIKLGKVVGMIALANKRDGFSEEDKRAVEAMSPVFVEALSRKKS